MFSEPVAATTTGGHAVPANPGDVAQNLIDNNKPTLVKDSTVNGDGTNTLSLTVEGHTQNVETDKLADVIIIYDTSYSMYGQYVNDNGTNRRRNAVAREKVTKLVTDLLGKNTMDNRERVRIALGSFDMYGHLRQGFTTTPSDITGKLPNTDSTDSGCGGGTNWEGGLAIADTLAVRQDAETFVIFLTDGNPTLRYSRMTDNGSPLTNEKLRSTTYIGSGQGSNRDGDNNTGAKNTPDGYLNNAIDPNRRKNNIYSYQGLSLFGDLNNDAVGANYAAGLAKAQSITESGKHLYTIGFGQVDKLREFTNSAGGEYYSAANATELENVFSDIEKRIMATVGFNNISIDDGITSLTNSVSKTGLTNVDQNFHYYKRSKTSSTSSWGAWETWNPSSENCSDAVYDSAEG